MGWVCGKRKAAMPPALIAIAAAALLAPAPAAAGPNDLFFAQCLTADQKIRLYAGGRSRVNGCVRVDSVDDEGSNTGLRGLSRPVVSPNGESVYAVARGDAAVARFFVNGTFVAYRDCITADLDVKPGENACKHLDATASGGVDTGLDGLNSLAISPSGLDLYGTSPADAALVHFRRAADGALSFTGCVTADAKLMQPGAGGICTKLIPSTADGQQSGLDDLSSAVVSPDGSRVFALATGDAALVSFEREIGGAPGLPVCLTADDVFDEGTAGCSRTPATALDGQDSGLHLPVGIAVSPNSRQVYVSTVGDASIVRIDVAADGSLSLGQCITADSNVPPGVNACAHVPNPAPNGADTGFESLTSLALGPDGTSLYAAASSDAAVLRFTRAADGTIALAQCITAATAIPVTRNGCVRTSQATATGQLTGLFSPSALAVSPDGSLLAGSSGDSAVFSFELAADGSMTQRECIAAELRIPDGTNNCKFVHYRTESAADTGLDGLSGVAFSPDGRNIYSGGAADASLLNFGREVPEPPPGARDLTPPELRIDRFKRRLSGPITFLVGCGEACVIEAVGKVVAKFRGKRRKVTLDEIRFPVFSALDELVVELGRKARRLARKALRKGGKAKLKLKATATDFSGNTDRGKAKAALRR